MVNIIRLWVYDRPGTLDSITGLIRRKGVNIRSLTAGDTTGGISQITISFKDYIEINKLGEFFSGMMCIKSWEKCLPDSHIVRELLLVRANVQHRGLLEENGLKIVKEKDGLLYAEYVASPDELDTLVETLTQQQITCVRTGALGLAMRNEDEAING